MIRDRIFSHNYGDTRVREKLISTDDLTLEKAIEICRAAEATRDRMQSISDLNLLLPTTPFNTTTVSSVVTVVVLRHAVL